MRTIVIITKRGAGYVSSVSVHRGVHGGRCGLTPYEAAASAARLMVEHAQGNPDGGDLMAPPEVMELVPERLRSIDDEVLREAMDGRARLPVPVIVPRAKK